MPSNLPAFFLITHVIVNFIIVICTWKMEETSTMFHEASVFIKLHYPSNILFIYFINEYHKQTNGINGIK